MRSPVSLFENVLHDTIHQSLQDHYLYGLVRESGRSIEIDSSVKKIGVERIEGQFLVVYEELKKILAAANNTFNKLLSHENETRFPRYFQVVFLALHELLINREMKPSNSKAVADKMIGLSRNIAIGAGGGNWSAGNRQDNVLAIAGLLQPVFVKREETDPALNAWIVELENILMQSFTEQTHYDFKIGLHRLDASGSYDPEVINKIIKTLTAIANYGPKSVGYVIIGVADKEIDAIRHSKLYGNPPVQFNRFHITGVEDEANKNIRGLDGYLQRIRQSVSDAPIPGAAISQINRDTRLVHYYGKAVVVMKIVGGVEPYTFDSKFYERHVTDVIEVKTENLTALFRRFLQV